MIFLGLFTSFVVTLTIKWLIMGQMKTLLTPTNTSSETYIACKMATVPRRDCFTRWTFQDSRMRQ